MSGFYDPNYCCDGYNKPYAGPSGHQKCPGTPCAPDCLHSVPSSYPNEMNDPAYRKMYGYNNDPMHPSMRMYGAWQDWEWLFIILAIVAGVAIFFVLRK